MPEVGGFDCVTAWQNAVRLLLDNRGELSNLLLTIENPTDLDETWFERFNPQAVDADADNMSDVVNTIFPHRLYSRYPNRDELYHRYINLDARSRRMRRNRGAWGTYFGRLVQFGAGGPNQLETVISKLSRWPNRVKTGLVFHLSSAHLDNPRTRGGPCWQFGELLWQENDVIDFVAVYRNHDYFNKALGNLIALGQLLDFICRESGKEPGKLTCHSVHAYFDGSQARMRNFVQN